MGQLSLAESVTFNITDPAVRYYRYAYGVPDSPWALLRVYQKNEKISELEAGSGDASFEIKEPKIGEVTFSFVSVLSVAATQTASGATLEIEPKCGQAEQCSIHLTMLPEGTVAELLAPPKGPGKILEVVLEKKGKQIELNTEELKGVTKIRLEFKDHASKTSATVAWQNVDTNAAVQSKISISNDAVVRVDADVNTTKTVYGATLAFFNSAEKDTPYLIAKKNNISWGRLEEYSDSNLSLQSIHKGIPFHYGYSLINAVANTADGKQMILLPVPAVNPNHRNLTSLQSTPEFVTIQEAIEIKLPEGIKVKSRLFECTDLTRKGCGRIRGISWHEKKSPGGFTIVPEEAQVTGLWFLILEVSEGRFANPDFWTRFTFGLSHHWTFGKRPDWVVHFYVGFIIGGLILLIIFFVMLGRIKRARAGRKRIADAEASALRDLLGRDPAFSVEAFKTRGRHIAEKIQHAWTTGDMRECRRYLSQGVYNRFRIQLRIMREMENRKNVMADFKIREFSVFARHRSGPFDALIVRLDAEARDTMVDVDLPDSEALKAARKAPLNGFVEYYTFMRKRGSTTQPGGDVDQCSHCGTQFSGEGEINKCKSCGAVMGSGTYDWVLAEITQESEYGRNAPRKKLQEDMSVDRLEDRASFIFWRDIMAHLSGKKDFIRRDASAAYLEKQFDPLLLYDIAVGGADLENFENNGPTKSAQVRIKWSAATNKASEVRHRESVLSLSATVNQPDGSGFAEHSCATCGAPLPETDSETCSYCRSPIQAKNPDWLLDGVETTVE